MKLMGSLSVRCVLTAMLSTALLGGVTLADTVELNNGDTLSGDVKSLNDKHLVLETEVLGEVKLPRKKIAAIYMGDRKPGPAAMTAVPRHEAVPPGLRMGSPDQLVEMLRQQGGIDAGTMKQLEQQVPMLALPQVRSYFNEKVGGLMSGEIDMQQLRKDAIHARDQLQDLTEDLKKQFGPGADQMLSNYTTLLDRFIRETAPEDAADEKNSQKESRAK